MTRDQSKVAKKEMSSVSKKREELNKKRKKVENSDSDNDSNDGSDTENDEMDVHEYRKFLSKIFPSKHLNKKIKAGEKIKKL